MFRLISETETWKHNLNWVHTKSTPFIFVLVLSSWTWQNLTTFIFALLLCHPRKRCAFLKTPLCLLQVSEPTGTDSSSSHFVEDGEIKWCVVCFETLVSGFQMTRNVFKATKYFLYNIGCLKRLQFHILWYHPWIQGISVSIFQLGRNTEGFLPGLYLMLKIEIMNWWAFKTSVIVK